MEAGGNVLNFVGDWMLVRIQPQRERRIARHFQIAEIQHFLPIEIKIKRYPHGPSGGADKKIMERVAWPGWIFCCGDFEPTWWAIAETMECAGMAPGKNPSKYIWRIAHPVRLVNALHEYQQAMIADRSFSPLSKIDPGDEVVVTAGEFQNFRGTVEYIDRFFARVRIQFAGAGAELKIDRERLELVT